MPPLSVPTSLVVNVVNATALSSWLPSITIATATSSASAALSSPARMAASAGETVASKAASAIVGFISILPYLIGIGIPIIIVLYFCAYIYAVWNAIRRMHGEARERRLARYRKYWPAPARWFPFSSPNGNDTVWVAAHEEPLAVVKPQPARALAVLPPQPPPPPPPPPAPAHVNNHNHRPEAMMIHPEAPPPPYMSVATLLRRHPECPFADHRSCPAC